MRRRIVKYLLLFTVIIILSYGATPFIRSVLFATGVFKEEVTIAGTGSMYPTFPKSEGSTDIVRANETVAWPQMRQFPATASLFGLKLYSYELQRSDIVEFESEQTEKISREKYGKSAGFVKRIIALPGDTVELRDGYVNVNGKILDEPYTAKPRSTYGGSFINDCQPLKVPEGKVFVLGDNRKASLDSRFDLGFVDINHIHYVISVSSQEDYRKNWRNTADDLSLAHTPTLDTERFVSFLNNKRSLKKLKPLKSNQKLADSAKIRGQAMIRFNDFTVEATTSAITLKKSIEKAKYTNVIFAEIFTKGFYEAEELLDNFLEFPDTQKILFSSQYQDIGISPVLGEIASCPVQTVVVHFGGFVPPSYTRQERESWENLIAVIDKVLPSWKSLQNQEGIDQEKLNRLLSLLEQRKSNALRIAATINANRWLSEEEKRIVEEDKNLNKQVTLLIEELNRNNQ